MTWYKNLQINKRKTKVTIVKKPVAVPALKLITHLLNDISTPELIKTVPVPTPIGPKFTVSGYKGGGFALNTVQGQAAHVFVTITNALNNMNQVVENKLKKWATTSNLIIVPRAGRMLNAYYNRSTLSFFYYKDLQKNKDFFTADSADIVAHELGHAILDAYRPDLWSSASLEAWAFHESFGDLTAMLLLMSYDEILNYVHTSTNGTLREFNTISSIAEDFARVASRYSSGKDTAWLRSAMNSFNYVKPETLPNNGPDMILTREPHSFSRVMTAVFYDLWVAFYNQFKSESIESIQAMRNARNLLARYVMLAIQNTPNTNRFFTGVANTLLAIDRNSGGEYQSIMHQVFVNRNLISSIGMLSYTPHVHSNECHHIKLCDCNIISHQHYNPLFNVYVQVPDNTLGSIYAAKDMIDFLHTTNNVSDDPNTPFEISNGKLKRSLFKCGFGSCGSSNQTNPTQPEYYKPVKPQNNAGCYSNCNSTKEIVKKTIKRGCFVRYKTNS